MRLKIITSDRKYICQAKKNVRGIRCFGTANINISENFPVTNIKSLNAGFHKKINIWQVLFSIQNLTLKYSRKFYLPSDSVGIN